MTDEEEGGQKGHLGWGDLVAKETDWKAVGRATQRQPGPLRDLAGEALQSRCCDQVSRARELAKLGVNPHHEPTIPNP